MYVYACTCVRLRLHVLCARACAHACAVCVRARCACVRAWCACVRGVPACVRGVRACVHACVHVARYWYAK